ncbi:hypothetical protein OG729_00580 [Streptomyces sp. NBC_00210]|uniref:hypothetical protein n=1 Tax=unclassified Streptomyces TaxID=2593676 RepID=UPI00324AA40E
MNTELDSAGASATVKDTGTDSQPSTEDAAAHRALALLAQHRLVTTPQMHQMLSPGSVRQLTSTVLNALREDKLASYTVLPNTSRMRAWFLTPRGAGWPPAGRCCAAALCRHWPTPQRPHCAPPTP